MRNINRFVSILMSAAICMSSITITYADDTEYTETVEYIVRYNTDELLSAGGNPETGGSGTATVEEALENNLTGATDIRTIDEFCNGEGHTTKLFSINTVNKDETYSELNNISGIYYAELNYKIHKLDADPGLSQQWAINGTNAYGINTEKAWTMSQGDDVLVAVIDTGVDISHRDLSSNIYTNPNETVNGADSDNNGYKDDIHGWDFTTYQDLQNNGDNSVYDDPETDKHGTHVAGIIAAASNTYDGKGVAPNAKILPIKILSENDGTVFAAIKGIEYAETMGAKIANCSWGSEHYSQFLYDTMAKSNMFFVCAAGNDGADVEKLPTYPAAYDLDNIISVGAVNSQGKLASFSNYGNGVDVAAPGEDIYSTLPQNGFGKMDGTSMAAPFVSGSAAIIWSSMPELTAEEVKNRILETVNSQSQLAYKVDTSGIIDASSLMLTTVKPENFTDVRSGNRVIVVENEMYSIGGYNGEEHTGKIEKFNPSEKVWQTIAVMPEKVSNCAVGSVNNKIFIVGGINGTPSDKVQIYDINSGAWTNGANIPESICGSAFVQKENILYLFGGTGITGIQNCVYKYDMTSDEWTKGEDLPEKMTYSAAVLSKDDIYVVGGANEKGVINSIYLYDSENDTFEYAGHLTVGRKKCSAVSVEDKIYILGGSGSFNTYGENWLYMMNDAKGAYIEMLTDAVEVFNTETRICSLSEALPDGIMGSGAINYFGKVYLFGGWDGEFKKTVSEYFGASVPRNVRIKTTGNKLNIKWNPVSGATGYKIEVDGAVYELTDNMYQIAAADNVEHKVRVQAVFGNYKSDWSEYTFFYSNSTLLDAKIISVNSQTNDKLYKTGQVRWYKLDNSKAGKISISLGDIPQNCDYLVQLCDLGGNVIATGNVSGDTQTIENVVLSPYPYYIKVSSIYGGNENIAYSLSCSFEVSSEETVPDRVRSAFLKPSSFEGMSFENGMKSLSDYTGTEEPPFEISDNSAEKANPEEINGGNGTNAYVEESETENLNEAVETKQISLTSLNNYAEEIKTLTSKGATASGSITVPRNTPSSSERCKVVIEVIPDNVYDEMRIEWTGSNTDYENFWWHSNESDGNHIYYLTALLGRSSSSKTYNYKITCDYLAPTSSGRCTVKKYIICDSRTNEDYNNTACGNEVPLYAESADPSVNQSIKKTGKIDHPYDRDFYYVTASSNEKVTAYLESPNGKKYDVAIYDNRCTTNNQYKSEYMDGWVGADASYATIKGKSSSSNKYCIRVGSYDQSFSYDDTYTLYVYKYSISKLGDLEVNNSFDNADSLKSAVLGYLGTTEKAAKSIKFSIDSPVDVDMYGVDMNAGDKLSVKMALPTNYNDATEKYRIEIYSDVRKADKSTIHTVRSYNNPDTSSSKYVTFIAPKNGTYYVAVRSLANRYNYSKYGSLLITKTSSANMDSYENKGNESSNDFARTTVASLFGYEFFVDGCTPLQGTVNANFDNELDVDWYKFVNGTETKTAVIGINGANISTAAGVIVLDNKFDLLTAGVSGNVYTFMPNETYYIAAYVNDNKYSSIMNNRNYSISVSLEELRSDLRFTPLEWGTFVYDNDPEFLTDDDMADYNLGNRLLMSADGLTGVVDFQSSHSAKPYMLENENISLDMILYNPTDQKITVEVDRMGYQSPYENNLASGKIDWTTTNWVCLQAWADFLQFDIDKKMFVGDLYENYESYKFKYVQNQLPNGGVYIIEPGQSVWMFGENSCLTMTHNVWSPFNIVARLKILNGELNIGFAAFRNRENVYSPGSARLIYDINTQRSYPSEYAVCSHECDCLCDCGCDCYEKYGAIYERDCRCSTKSCIHSCVKEHDVNGKPKGVANAVAEVETHTVWNINDSTEYFTPTVYNYANPNGFTIDGSNNFHWITNFNPNADAYGGYNAGVESDIIPLTFEETDSNGNRINRWIFDNRHTNPGSGNRLFTENPPVLNAMPLGNYGVVERYYIDITNASTTNKKITYKMKTGSHAIVTYKDGNNGWKRKIKLGELYDMDNETAEEFEIRKEKNIFDIDISSGETKQLVLEVILPNADAGGYQHQLKCE